MPGITPVDVFFSYAPEDEDLRKKLEQHLALLQRQGIVRRWNDRMVSPGAEWRGEVDQRLLEADLILLLVSASYLASDYLYDVELAQALARHEAGAATVIPVILRPCDWDIAPFGAQGRAFARPITAYPTRGRPVTTWPNLDEALVDVALGIRLEAIKKFTTNASSISGQYPAVTLPAARSVQTFAPPAAASSVPAAPSSSSGTWPLPSMLPPNLGAWTPSATPPLGIPNPSRARRRNAPSGRARTRRSTSPRSGAYRTRGTRTSRGAATSCSISARS